MHLFAGTQIENMADMVRKGRQNKLRGEQHGSAKLTEKQVLAIRKDPRIGRVIAEDYGISQPLVSHIKTKRVWKHL